MMELQLRQQYIKAVVRALGGPTRVAYLAGGVSNQTIYNWVEAGVIVLSKPMLMVANAAREHRLIVWGAPVTAESLAGLIDPPAPVPDEPSAASKGKPARRKRLRLVEPEAAVAAARAKLDAAPPMAHGYVRKKRNNCPLLAA